MIGTAVGTYELTLSRVMLTRRGASDATTPNPQNIHILQNPGFGSFPIFDPTKSFKNTKTYFSRGSNQVW